MKSIKIILVGIVASMYLFHFEFVGLEGFNTKRMLAMGGTALFLLNMIYEKNHYIDKNFIQLAIYALTVSLIGFISITINFTPDYAYATYIGSMFVWLSAAYFVVKLMEGVHGKVTVRIICNYFICVCVAQCIIAVLIDQIPAVKKFVDTYFELDQKFLDNTVGIKRKYGIGASVDVAGTRFSAILVTLAVMLRNAQRDGYVNWVPFYIISFVVISFIGNIISRTTTVGVLLVIGYGIYQLKNIKVNGKNSSVIKWIMPIVLLGVGGGIYLYNTNKEIRQDIRFGFEGFFSLVETGEWEVSSNDKLKGMYVLPDNTKTWIIGDGYFSNPTNTDKYFIGEVTGGYYKGSDAGYIRFIFYFGIIGLIAFSLYFIKAAQICANSFKKYQLMFYILALVNFIVWIKVATDIFIVFAPFLCLAFMTEKDKDNELILTI